MNKQIACTVKNRKIDQRLNMSAKQEDSILSQSKPTPILIKFNSKTMNNESKTNNKSLTDRISFLDPNPIKGPNDITNNGIFKDNIYYRNVINNTRANIPNITAAKNTIKNNLNYYSNDNDSSHCDTFNPKLQRKLNTPKPNKKNLSQQQDHEKTNYSILDRANSLIKSSYEEKRYKMKRNTNSQEPMNHEYANTSRTKVRQARGRINMIKTNFYNTVNQTNLKMNVKIIDGKITGNSSESNFCDNEDSNGCNNEAKKNVYDYDPLSLQNRQQEGLIAAQKKLVKEDHKRVQQVTPKLKEMKDDIISAFSQSRTEWVNTSMFSVDNRTERDLAANQNVEFTQQQNEANKYLLNNRTFQTNQTRVKKNMNISIDDINVKTINDNQNFSTKLQFIRSKTGNNDDNLFSFRDSRLKIQTMAPSSQNHNKTSEKNSRKSTFEKLKTPGLHTPELRGENTQPFPSIFSDTVEDDTKQSAKIDNPKNYYNKALPNQKSVLSKNPIEEKPQESNKDNEELCQTPVLKIDNTPLLIDRQKYKCYIKSANKDSKPPKIQKLSRSSNVSNYKNTNVKPGIIFGKNEDFVKDHELFSHITEASDDLYISKCFYSNHQGASKGKIFIPDVNRTKKQLLQDLDETLIWTYKDSKSLSKPTVCIRPYCNEFLTVLSSYWNLAVFTASSWGYAKYVIKEIDPDDKFFCYLFHREHCLLNKDFKFLKDLRIISNFELKDIQIIDNKVISFAMQIDNGILIYPYVGNDKDTQLKEMIPYLIKLSKVPDIKDDIRYNYNLRYQIKMHLGKIKKRFGYLSDQYNDEQS